MFTLQVSTHSRKLGQQSRLEKGPKGVAKPSLVAGIQGRGEALGKADLVTESLHSGSHLSWHMPDASTWLRGLYKLLLSPPKEIPKAQALPDSPKLALVLEKAVEPVPSFPAIQRLGREDWQGWDSRCGATEVSLAGRHGRTASASLSLTGHT